MVGIQGIHKESNNPEQQGSNPADGEVWAQLGELVSHNDFDPVLRLLFGEAKARHEEMRGVTATIASRYRALVDAVPDAVIIHDESGNVLDANESACRLYLQERESILQSSLLTLNPGLAADFLSSLHNAPGEERSHTATSTIVREDGTSSDLELHAREYLDSGNIRIIVVIRDLGPREAAIQQLRASESWQRSLMQAIDKGVMVWDRRGRILSANPAACRAFRMSEVDLCAFTPDQLEGWRFHDASGQSMRLSALPWIRSLANGKPHESEICGISIPGAPSALWVSVSTVPHFDVDQGEADKVACMFSDITPIQRNAMMFAQVQSLNNLGAWQLDLEKDYLFCSAQMHAILDVPISTPLTLARMLRHFAETYLERFRQALGAAREGRHDEFEALMTTSIGRRRRVRIRLRPLHDGLSVHAVFGTLKDITRDTAIPPL